MVFKAPWGRQVRTATVFVAILLGKFVDELDRI